MFLKCYCGLLCGAHWSLVTRKQHSDYAVSSDKLRVMTRDGSGSEGEYLAYLAPTGSDWLWAWEQLSDLREVPHFFQLIVYLVYLVGRINLTAAADQWRAAITPCSWKAKYLLFLKIQMFGLRLPGAE